MPTENFCYIESSKSYFWRILNDSFVILLESSMSLSVFDQEGKLNIVIPVFHRSLSTEESDHINLKLPILLLKILLCNQAIFNVLVSSKIINDQWKLLRQTRVQ